MDNFLFDMAAAVTGLLGIVFKALSPLVIGLVIAYLLSPVVNWFEERIKSRFYIYPLWADSSRSLRLALWFCGTDHRSSPFRRYRFYGENNLCIF